MAVLSRAFFLTISKTACNGQPRREYLDEGIDPSWPQRRANYQQTTIGEEGVMWYANCDSFLVKCRPRCRNYNDVDGGGTARQSGSFKTESGFKSVEDMILVGEKHTYSHGVTWGIVSNDNPLRIKQPCVPTSANWRETRARLTVDALGVMLTAIRYLPHGQASFQRPEPVVARKPSLEYRQI